MRRYPHGHVVRRESRAADGLARFDDGIDELVHEIRVRAAMPVRLKALLCVVFILITSPTAAHALARAARISGIELWEKSVVDQFEEA